MACVRQLQYEKVRTPKFRANLDNKHVEERWKNVNIGLRKLCNMYVEVYVFMKALTMKKFSYTLWRVRILQHWTKP